MLLQPDDSLQFSLEVSFLTLADAASSLATALLTAPLRFLQQMDAAITLAQEGRMQTSQNQ